MTMKMGRLAVQATLQAIAAVNDGADERAATEIRSAEDQLDKSEDNLNRYLVKLSSRELTAEDSFQVSILLHMIGDLERTGDHALNILESAEEIREKGVAFSSSAKDELQVAHAALSEILENALNAMISGDTELARKIEPLEQTIDELIETLRVRHIARLQRGECDILNGYIWADLLGNYERISDHCSNIAGRVLQGANHDAGTHSYMSELRDGSNAEFAAALRAYEEKYALKS
jgi:phosphate:Na+ symporter